MNARVVTLDTVGATRLVVTDAGLEVQGAEDLHSVTPKTVQALRRQLLVRSPDGTTHQADPDGRFRRFGAVYLGSTVLAEWTPDALEARARLSPFELRLLAETGLPPARAVTAVDAPPRTDLHTHFAGCPRPESLIELGLRHDLSIDGRLLDEAGVHGVAGLLPLRSLSPAMLQRYQAALSLPVDRQSTFLDMERAYRLRSPFSKSLALFPHLLDVVADDYARAQVSRVELSIGDLFQQAWLQQAVAASRRAEERHGLQLRFLTAISRHNDEEWDEDLLERLAVLGPCRELVGVDWMGHETNSTRAFAARLTRVARWAHTHRKGFVLRVHAGENPAFPENVRCAVDAVKGLEVSLRIGHALFGSDEALEALREHGAVVELNLTSNFTLNNLHTVTQAPLGALLDAGVHCVLGTDGPGLYGTSPGDELRVARLAGLTDAQRARLATSEAFAIEQSRRSEASCPATFAVPTDPPPRSFTPAVAARKSRERADQRARLELRLKALGVEVLDGPQARALLSGRTLSVAGAWRDAWAKASPGSRARITAVLDELIPALPKDVVLVTGGTTAGVEGEVHRRARVAGLRVLATIVEATWPEDLDGQVTDATFISRTPHEKAAVLYSLLRDVDALCVFCGGGNVVHDEVRAAANLRLRHLALAGVDGASGEWARRVPHRAFVSAAEVLRRLDDRAFFRQAFEPFWHPGVNPTVDVVALRGDEVLLIRRHLDAPAEPGQWALPGGFVHTLAPRGEPFRFDVEQPLDTAIRELFEETGLQASALKDRFVLVGEVEGGGRDERDTALAFSRSWVFRVDLDDAHAGLPLSGGDDADDARWFKTSALPGRLAFDHAALLRRALDGSVSQPVIGAPVG